MAFLSLLGLLAGCASPRCCDQSRDPARCPPEAPREARGVWVATVSNIDWPSQPGLSTAEQQREMRAILDRARELRLNVVIFQVRTSCDAMYRSPYEPWSYYLTARQGQPPEPYYDPLKLWIDEAHARGLELHAWFNPFRAKRFADACPLDAHHVANAQPRIVRTYGQHLWLDPGEPAAQEWSLRVIMDVVRRYDVDGVHIDDYFYPYPEKQGGGPIDFPDAAAWQSYRDSGGQLARADWRRQNIDTFVRRLNGAVHREKAWVKFGISPFGIWRPGSPPGVQGFDAYAQLYADSKLWWNNGWCDYLAPQLYWRPHDPPKPTFKELSQWWSTENSQHRQLWTGLIPDKIERDGKSVDRGWQPHDIVEEIAIARQTPGVSGQILFSARSLLQDRQGLVSVLRDGPYTAQALVPLAPGASGRRRPPAPGFTVVAGPDDTVQVDIQQPWFATPFLWGVYAKYGEVWKFVALPASAPRCVLPADLKVGAARLVTVTMIDRQGLESRKTEPLAPEVRGGKR